ncbi:MAG: sporulation protein YqfD [Bacillota bacterium]
MLLKHWWFYIWGYVVLQVEGPALEKFINLAIERGSYLWDAAWVGAALRVKVNIGGFWALRHIARKTGCRFVILRKAGLPFYYIRLRRRKMLAMGAVFFLVALYYMSSFFWFVQVKSTEELRYLDEDRILKVARFYGLYPGVAKGKVKLPWVENGIAANLPEIAYVVVKTRGTAATIEVVERNNLQKNYVDKRHANIIAAKDGVVTEILVLTGEGKVNEGDTVRKGQVLISGVIQPPIPEVTGTPGTGVPPQPPPILTRAKGLVRARIWYQADGEAPLVLTEGRLTGQSQTGIRVVIGNKTLELKGPRKPPYAYYQEQQTVKTLPRWRNIQIPVEVISTTYLEVKKVSRDLGLEGANQLAVDLAWKKIHKEIPQQSRIEHQQVEIMQAGPEKVRIRLTVETIEDIAEVMPFEGQ